MKRIKVSEIDKRARVASDKRWMEYQAKKLQRSRALAGVNAADENWDDFGSPYADPLATYDNDLVN